MMKSYMGLALLCAGLLLLSACDSDDPVAIPEIPLVEIVIPSSDYLNHRFFKLDLPFLEPGGRLQGDWILPESIKVFQMMPGDIPEPGDITNVAVYVDSLGFRNWDSINFQEPHLFGTRWREIYQWDVQLDFDGNLVAVDLRSSIPDQDVLAVVYDVHLADGSIKRVGDRPGLDIPEQEVPGGDGLYFRMKLLKAPVSDKEPFTFQYVLRNIYSLGISNIDYTNFNVWIERNDAGASQPRQDETGLDYIRIFGLDRDSPQGTGFPDGLADWWDPYIFDLAKGLLKFPQDFPRPFAPGGRIQTEGDPQDVAAETAYAAQADTAAFVWNPSYLRDHQAWQLYDPAVLPAEYPQFGHFRIISSYPDPERYQPWN